jgi:hypothetical protein
MKLVWKALDLSFLNQPYSFGCAFISSSSASTCPGDASGVQIQIRKLPSAQQCSDTAVTALHKLLPTYFHDFLSGEWEHCPGSLSRQQHSYEECILTNAAIGQSEPKAWSSYGC